MKRVRRVGAFVEKAVHGELSDSSVSGVEEFLLTAVAWLGWVCALRIGWIGLTGGAGARGMEVLALIFFGVSCYAYRSSRVARARRLHKES